MQTILVERNRNGPADDDAQAGRPALRVHLNGTAAAIEIENPIPFERLVDIYGLLAVLGDDADLHLVVGVNSKDDAIVPLVVLENDLRRDDSGHFGSPFDCF
jgi:hypothetical protein